MFFNQRVAVSEVICELVWLLYLVMLHAHIIDIKSNTFFLKCAQSIKSIYWTYTMYLVLEKVLRVRRRNSSLSHPVMDIQDILASHFLALYSKNFYLHSTLLAHFLDFIIYQSQILNCKHHCLPVVLTCSSAGHWFSIRRKTSVYQNPLKILQHSFLHLYTFCFSLVRMRAPTHTRTLLHLENTPYVTLASFS